MNKYVEEISKLLNISLADAKDVYFAMDIRFSSASKRKIKQAAEDALELVQARRERAAAKAS